MANRWIWVAKWGVRALFLSASWLLGWIIGHGWAKAYEHHVLMRTNQPFTPWSATLQIAWDFLICSYLSIPVLLIGFGGLRFFSSLLGDSASMRRGDAFYTLGAFALMLLALFYEGLGSSAVQW